MDKKKKQTIGAVIVMIILYGVGFISGLDSANNNLELEIGELGIIINHMVYEKRIVEGANDILAKSVKDYYELTIAREDIIEAHIDISKIAMEKYQASQEDLLKERDELYSCWSNAQTLDSILRLKYNWDGALN